MHKTPLELEKALQGFAWQDQPIPHLLALPSLTPPVQHELLMGAIKCALAGSSPWLSSIVPRRAGSFVSCPSVLLSTSPWQPHSPVVEALLQEGMPPSEAFTFHPRCIWSPVPRAPNMPQFRGNPLATEEDGKQLPGLAR